MEKLKDRMAKVTIETILSFVDKGFDISLCDSNGNSLLHALCESDNIMATGEAIARVGALLPEAATSINIHGATPKQVYEDALSWAKSSNERANAMAAKASNRGEMMAAFEALEIEANTKMAKRNNKRQKI